MGIGNGYLFEKRANESEIYKNKPPVLREFLSTMEIYLQFKTKEKPS